MTSIDEYGETPAWAMMVGTDRHPWASNERNRVRRDFDCRAKETMADLTEVIDPTPPSDPDAPIAAGKRRVVDRLDPRLVNLLTALGFGLPIVGYLWAVWHYSVNVIVSDQLSDVAVVKASHSHLIPWGALWTQHNEERMVFPRLLTILLAHTDNLNIRFEDFIGAAMLIVATGLLIWAHKRRSPSTPWLYYCPVAVLAFSLVQYQNAVWGFQMAWYLVLLSLAVAIVLLDRITLSWPVFIGAAVIAAIGSFSSLQGLIIWPVGFVLLYHRRRSVAFIFTWIGATLVAAVLYFRDWSSATGVPDDTYALHHLWFAFKFYLFTVGDVVGFTVPAKPDAAANNNVILFGLIIVIIAVAALVVYGLRRDERSGAPIGVALICFGLLFAASITEGRSDFGYFGAAASRYTTFDLLILIGIYLTLLGRPILLEPREQAGAPPGELPTSSPSRSALIIARALPVTRWIVAGVIVVQVLLGLQQGIEGLRNSHQSQEAALRVSLHLDRNPNSYLVFFVDPNFVPGPWIRQQLQAAEKLHIGEYANTR